MPPQAFMSVGRTDNLRVRALRQQFGIFYTSQASGFVVSQTYGAEAKTLPAVWERPNR